MDLFTFKETPVQITKRDYFIGCALTGLLSHPTLGNRVSEQLISEAIQHADAVILKLTETSNVINQRTEDND